MLQTPNPPNSLVYRAFEEAFVATDSTLRVSCSARDGSRTEQRELHVTAAPRSPQLKRRLGKMVFRIVEIGTDRPTDNNGNAIVGGVNTFPEPVHVVLFMSADTIVMLNQRAAAGELVISICPGVSLSEWDQSDAVPVYEATFQV